MAAANTTQQRLMRERARALATLLLTRRPDLVVQDVTDDIGVDLVVRVVPRGKHGLRQFGVELRYVLEPVTRDHADKVIQPTLAAHLSYGPFPFPVVMFFFTMRNDEGWYTWVAEPVVLPEGQTQLPLRAEPHCRRLNDESVDEMVGQVNHWYDARYDPVASSSSNGRRGKNS